MRPDGRQEHPPRPAALCRTGEPFHGVALAARITSRRRAWARVREDAMKRARAILAGLCALGFAGPAAAQDWPTRPVTMVIPFAAGGALDVLGRILGPGLSDGFGRPIITENVGGA